MKIFTKAITLEELTKETITFVQDDDCHWFGIHKDDKNYFNYLLELSIKKDNYDDFTELFGDNMLGCSPNYWMEKNLKQL